MKTPEKQPRKKGGKKGAGPIDHQSEHVMTTLRAWSDAMVEGYQVEKPGDFKEHVRSNVQAVQKALGCRAAFLACRRGPKSIPTLAPNELDEVEAQTWQSQLSSLFQQALNRQDGTFAQGLAVGKRPTFVCCAGNLDFQSARGSLYQYALLLACVDRKAGPDPEFPKMKFLTYDEIMLRVAFWSIARFVRCQLGRSWDYYENAQEDGRSAEKRLAANMVLDIESFLGLDTNAEVLCTWLEAEKELFLPAGEIKEETYKKTLTEGRGLAERIRDPKEKQHARRVLFECWLAQLSRSGKRGLLSERIEKAEKWAGFETVKGKR